MTFSLAYIDILEKKQLFYYFNMLECANEKFLVSGQLIQAKKVFIRIQTVIRLLIADCTYVIFARNFNCVFVRSVLNSKDLYSSWKSTFLQV